MRSLQSFRRAYAGLLIVRVCFAVFGTGYIHPDEYFQNGEVTAGMFHLQRFTMTHVNQAPKVESLAITIYAPGNGTRAFQCGLFCRHS